MVQLRLGVIGLSPGNGHPYSWAAIFNGYDEEAMAACGFPAIPAYLARQEFPRDAIAAARVTHVWAQDRALAEHIARASRIERVVDRFTDLIGEIDGVLLARDDAERHYEFAKPFLDAGLPIYIDKPMALSTSDAQRMFDAQRHAGQIFSCSALRYAQELRLSPAQQEAIGPIRHIHATVPKDWDRYAVHIVEPLLVMMQPLGPPEALEAWREKSSTNLLVGFPGGSRALVSALGPGGAPIAMRVMGDHGWCDLVFHDTFAAFKAALEDFVTGIVRREPRIESAFTMNVVRLIEAGRSL